MLVKHKDSDQRAKGALLLELGSTISATFGGYTSLGED